MATPSSVAHPFDDRDAGNLFMVVAPSGAGKSTLVNALLVRIPIFNCRFRSLRVRRVLANRAAANITSLESMSSSGGARPESSLRTPKFMATITRRRAVWIEERMRSGIDVLLEIDWQGARQVKAQFAHGVGIFILPPSIDALEARLKKRGQDSPAVIARRLLAARSEMEHAPEFQYIVINEDFDHALSHLMAIVAATRLRFSTQKARHRELFTQLGIG